MIYIVIPVFNRVQYTLACIEALSRQTYPHYRIIVVDDGSTDGTSGIISSANSHVILLQGDGNLWWTGSTNLGVKHAIAMSDSDHDCILTLNNDLTVKENYLAELISAAQQFPDTLIGSASVDINAPDTIHYAGTKWNSRTAAYRSAIARETTYPDLVKKGKLIPTDLLPGRGVLIPITIFKKIGLYDQKHFPHYMADEDFALRAKKAGFKLGISTGAVVHNHVHATGLKHKKKNMQYYIDVFTSMRSPANSTYRWNWAKRHASIPPPLYFTIDLMRILKSLLFKS